MSFSTVSYFYNPYNNIVYIGHAFEISSEHERYTKSNQESHKKPKKQKKKQKTNDGITPVTCLT